MPKILDINYSEDYIESCFYAWYKAGAPALQNKNKALSVGGTQVMKTLPLSPDGRKPNLVTVMSWMNRFGWRERADALDAQVSLKMDKEVVTERVRILRQLADMGQRLMDKGAEYIMNSDNPFKDNPSAAVRAIIAGSEMKYKYAGQADVLEGISSMSNKQLEREILHLLGKENNDDEEIDATLEDIPTGEDDDSTAEDDNSRGE